MENSPKTYKFQREPPNNNVKLRKEWALNNLGNFGMRIFSPPFTVQAKDLRLWTVMYKLFGALL